MSITKKQKKEVKESSEDSNEEANALNWNDQYFISSED